MDQNDTSFRQQVFHAFYDSPKDLRFVLNGKEVVLENVNPRTLLLDYLRSDEVGLTGSKKGCGQGGCGACTVMISRYDATHNRVENFSVNSCLHPLAMLDGMMVTTIEGTGDVATKVSPVQYRIAKENGSQCGFCTPGWVMNMHAYLANNVGKELKQTEINDIFDGNLCRCTGYRPILYAMRQFAADFTPIDRQGVMKTYIDPADKVNYYKKVSVDFPRNLRKPARRVYYEKNHYRWYRPITLDEVYSLLGHYHKRAQVQLVVGNTSLGIYGQSLENPQVYIDISQINELHIYDIGKDGLYLGAANNYTDALYIFKKAIAKVDKSQQQGLQALKYMAGRTAGHIIRNVASLAGNSMLVIKHIYEGTPFPSDLFTAWVMMDAEITVGSPCWNKAKRFSLLEYAWQYHKSQKLQTQTLILSYHLPYTRKLEYARTYKTALRNENAHSIVNAGFRVRLNEKHKVKEARLVLGGIAPIAVTLDEVEQFLIDRYWDEKTLAKALQVLEHQLDQLIEQWRDRLAQVPTDGFTNKYKKQLAESFLFKFFIYVAEQAKLAVPASIRSAGERQILPLSKGTQTFRKYEQEYPINKPYIKLSAFLQATGEAIYTHDMALPRRGLQGAWVVSDRAFANFYYALAEGSIYKRITIDQLIDHLKQCFPGVVNYISARDVVGRILQGDGQDDPIFCKDRCTTFGQSIAIVLADNEQVAQEAADYVSTKLIHYEKIAEPVIGIEAAAARGDIFPDNPKTNPSLNHIWKIKRANSDLTWAKKSGDVVIDQTPCQLVKGKMQVGSQVHFYMETQSAMAVPGESGQIKVHSSTQSPDSVVSSLKQSLEVDANKLVVQIKRLGGGYGGKTTRSPFVASPVAVAAMVANRVVKVNLRRDVDTAMIGHRHPVLGNYHIAIAKSGDNKGKLMGLKTDFLLNGGNTYDCSFVISDVLQLRSDTAYWIPNYQSSSDVVQTNISSNTAFRSVGAIQGLLIQEDAVEAAAHRIAMRAEDVREMNLVQRGQAVPDGQVLQYAYIKEVWDYLKKNCEFEKRYKQVMRFNKNNRWKKRGISMVPVKYGMGYNASFLEQAGALIEVYAQDGSVLVRQGGVEMGQGLMTKIAQIAAQQLNLPLTLINMGDTDTSVVPNPVSTGASTGTAFNGRAVSEACQSLRKRLEAYALGLLEKNGEKWAKKNHIDFWNYEKGWRHKHEGTLIWNNIVSHAHMDRINLSAQVRSADPGGTKALNKSNKNGALIFKKNVIDAGNAEVVDEFVGFTYSAACTEVELDILTGEVTILRTDIAYDMGKSLNPAIDVGQVEGAFVQGIGYILTERLVYQQDGPKQGALNTLNTWTYKPPAHRSIPLELHVNLYPRDNDDGPENPNLLFSAKEVGEPPLVLACTVYFAVKQAILASRKDRGHEDWFQLNCPATVQEIRDACLVKAADLKWDA